MTAFGSRFWVLGRVEGPSDESSEPRPVSCTTPTRARPAGGRASMWTSDPQPLHVDHCDQRERPAAALGYRHILRRDGMNCREREGTLSDPLHRCCLTQYVSPAGAPRVPLEDGRAASRAGARRPRQVQTLVRARQAWTSACWSEGPILTVGGQANAPSSAGTLRSVRRSARSFPWVIGSGR